MDSKNAIDTIFKIEEMMETIISKINILETSMNNLNNKMYVINSKMKNLSSENTHFGEISNSQPSYRPSASAPAHGPRASSPSPLPDEQPSSRLVLGNVKVYGYILNKAKKPLSEVYVRVFTDSSEVVKETKSNREGYWECRLPSGRFSVEYTHKNFKPINVIVNIPDGVKSFEVK